MILRNIEFNSIPGPAGDVEVRQETNPIFKLAPSNRDFIVAYIEAIGQKKPVALQRLEARFINSKENRPFYEFLICRRFTKCNFGGLDDRRDIDENGNFVTEFIQCPNCGECPDYGYVCNSDESVLRKSEQNVLRLIVSGHKNKEIAELLFISPATVHNHRNNMLERLAVKNTAGLIRHWYENNLK